MLFDGGLFGPDQPCFGCSPTHPNGLRLRFSREGDEVVTRFTPGPLHQGPPTVMHGGLVTTLVDELAGWTLILLREKFGFTGELTVKLLKPIRVGTEVEGRGRIARETHRVVRIAATLRQAGAVAVESSLAFAVLDRGGAEKMLGGPLPEAWLKYCR
jgi:acyl-coenzyme A thioesterase PaaI-like protein